MNFKIKWLLLLVLMTSCDNSEVTVDGPDWESKDFLLFVKNNMADSTKVSIKNMEYWEENLEMGFGIGLEGQGFDETIIDSDDSSQLIIKYPFGWWPDKKGKTMWERCDSTYSFMIEFEFESGEKISYWGLPQECDVIGYGVDYYGIAWVSKDTDGLYTVYDEDNRFANFALKAIINSPDDIEISVDYENSVIVEITD